MGNARVAERRNALVACRGDEDGECLRLFSSEPSDEIRTVHPRQIQIDQRDFRSISLLDSLQRQLRRSHCSGRVTDPGQQTRQCVASDYFIFDNQNVQVAPHRIPA